MNDSDPHNLQRFLAAQSENYEIALEELQRGRKRSHWIWYIFPQVAGLGHSSMAQAYAIQSRDEGLAYLEHEVLGRRLRECAAALLAHREVNIEDIMKFPDNLKLQSSMSLFASLSDAGSIFHRMLDLFYAGEMDSKTLDFLRDSQ